ncbi:DUF1826 domain-containing protein [Aquisalimonas sp.]|uniref:DUF1826 domain-containing protein n=1 Tax=unclassified Aquisalimonas TaxID=2644645 RepID=UPI0025BF6EF0|nr:DUF1826 domain-containing protein [Aquisalimonas sp.]
MTTMTLSDNALTPASFGESVEGEQCGVLDNALLQGVNMAIWRRFCLPEPSRELACIDAGWSEAIRLTTAVTSAEAGLRRALSGAGLDPQTLKHWITDMSGLAALFARLIGKSSVQIRIEAMHDTMCPRFHVDRNDLRLLCTYRGPATEWLTNSQVDRRALACGAPSEEVMRFGPSQRLNPWWVGIMKGSRFPGNEGNGLVHRSPSADGQSQSRILFCLDA